MPELAKPPEDREFMNHDPTAIPANLMGPHDESCMISTEVRHDHPQFGEDMRWSCTRKRGHLGRHATLSCGGLAASWARKV